MLVLKFGGTSLGTPERMQNVAQIARNSSEKRVIVLSAVAGTTDQLVQLTKEFGRGEVQAALDRISQLRVKYDNYTEKLFKTAEAKVAGQDILDTHLNELAQIVQQPYFEKSEKLILAQGELISTQLFNRYLEEVGVASTLLPALDFMVLNATDEPDLDIIQSKLSQLLAAESGDIFITQGYICRNSSGGIDNLKRGGSDYSATIIGAVMQSSEVQIWTDIDGMHNNDPRIVENTFPVAELSFDEAGELAYFGAKILHPTCILPAQSRNVPVRIKNTMDPSARGTYISSKNNPIGVKAIAVKDGITAIKIKSTRMINAYGFLRKVFEVFEKYRTSIDMVTTSEIAISLTIDNDRHLHEITEELKPYGTLHIDQNQSIICVVGDFVAERKGLGKDIFQSLDHIPVRMISYGGSKNNISVVIDTTYKKEALQSLNEGVFHLK